MEPYLQRHPYANEVQEQVMPCCGIAGHILLIASLIVGRCPNIDCPNIDDHTLRASLKYLIELHLVCGPHAENLSAVYDVINTQPTLIVTDCYETVPHEKGHILN